jgi:hypothetical protein
MDYGHDLHFGVFVAPDAARYDEVLTAVLLAHLAYEESQLVGPLNTLGIGI